MGFFQIVQGKPLFGCRRSSLHRTALSRVVVRGVRGVRGHWPALGMTP